MSLVVGIDPGLSGALCFLDERNGEIHLVDMPVCQGRTSDASEVDFNRLVSYISGYDNPAGYTPRLIAIEDVWGRAGQGGKSMFTFGAAFGALVSACAYSRIRTVRVLPKTWQAATFGANLPGETKEASRAWAISRYPRELFVRGAGKKPDHNRCDSAAIAVWASKRYPDAQA